MDEQLIEKWISDKTITKAQAKKMLADIHEEKSANRSSKFIVALSTIGALCLGIAAILFIASNWQELSNFSKTAMLVVSTFLAYFVGYYLTYQKKNFPRVGMALLFLAALLYGATIILITQIYNVNANNHIVVLLWLVGVIPLVYAMKSAPIAALSTVLFYLWIMLLFFERVSSSRIAYFFPFYLIAISASVFAIGKLHKLSSSLQKIGRIYRIISLKILLICLFLFTFEHFVDIPERLWNTIPAQTHLLFGFAFLAFLAACLTGYAWYRSKKEFYAPHEALSIFCALGLTCLALFVNTNYLQGLHWFYLILFNLLFAGLTLLLLYVGYHLEDMTLVNMGMFWLGVFLFAKYFDWFWELLSRSVFFFIGGILLVGGGIFLERKRRQLQESIKNNE